jgi:hypothetical protein
MFCIQHCFICRPSDSTVSEDAGIEPRTVTTSALALRHSARCHPPYKKLLACKIMLAPFLFSVYISISGGQYDGADLACKVYHAITRYSI